MVIGIGSISFNRKVIQLHKEGYLHCDIVKGDKFADKAVYSITEKGRTLTFQKVVD